MVKTIARSKDVIWRRINDDVVVIKDDGLSTYVLNKTAAFVWEMCNGEYDIDEIVTRISDNFDVTPEEARTDVNELVQILTKASILK